ncbi:Oidioi.mRNA.OKI2018_I69.chr1.g1416.t1.cds [Oikopleura dioica]|uniref:Oidioi.mRNA.OKI2018_I69.chr1.g1416.t1.cds n=1 Tax=Oikopleura dioica TaxID=34765 RepID=A0ABN7SPI6_OIKDI|nr:Oidioi.mRNA.OKI2018_I69.chr1.g1416.t1.cds [Oikopleura dioica]
MAKSSELDRRSVIFWTWVLFLVSILYFLFAGGALGYNAWWLDEYRFSVDKELPIVEIVYFCTSVCNFALSIVGIIVVVHLMLKRKSRITLQAYGLVVSVALVISVVLSSAMVILDNVAKVLARIEGIAHQNPENYFVKSPSEQFFYTIVILPLGHALFFSVISGLALGLNTRIHKIKKIEILEKQLHLPF